MRSPFKYSPCSPKRRVSTLSSSLETQELKRKIKIQRDALEYIRDWNFPNVFSNGEWKPLVSAWGSNGERDHVRNIAHSALDESI